MPMMTMFLYTYAMATVSAQIAFLSFIRGGRL
jgi:hypothetical protein